MEKFTKSKLVAQIAITSFVAALAIVGVAYATTIGTNISTSGTLTVSLSSTMATTTISSGDLIVDTDTLIVDNDNNRVGIGTTTPAYLLDVDGDFRVGIAGKANTFYVDSTNGRIGIATTTPMSAFSITDTGTYQMTVAYNGTNYTTLAVSSSGDLTLTPSGGDISLAGNSAITGILSVTGATSLSTASSTGGVKFPSIDSDTGAIGIGTSTPGSYLLDIDGDVRIGESGNANALTIDAGTGAIVINNDGAATADIRAEGDTNQYLFMLDASADRVGIGTSTPLATLSVETKAGDNAFVIGSSTATYLTVDTTGNLIVDTNTLYVDAVNNRVGVASTTPAFQLSIGNKAATSTIGMGKFCMYAGQEDGTMVYIRLSSTAASGSPFATSTTPCFN